MKTTPLKLAAACAVMILCLGPLAHGEPLAADAREDAARWVQQFVGQMKPLLVSSVKEHGPAAAISVCADAAPALADRLSTESGWQITRVSAKPRNVDRAVADAWESRVLAELDKRAFAGDKPPTLNYGETVDGEERYMQAQLIGGVCLLCHGSNIAADVQSALDARYPDDLATGYGVGDLRGAISLRRPMAP